MKRLKNNYTFLLRNQAVKGEENGKRKVGFLFAFSDGKDMNIFIGNSQGKRLRDDDMVSGLQINFPVVC